MKKQKGSTTNTTPSSSEFGCTDKWYGSSVTIDGPVVYDPPRSVLTKKQAFTQFLKDRLFYDGTQNGYLGLPRKLKKAYKRWIEKTCYFSKKYGVTRYNPYLLSVPIPELMFQLFTERQPLPITSDQPLRFNRILQLEDQCTNKP